MECDSRPPQLIITGISLAYYFNVLLLCFEPHALPNLRLFPCLFFPSYYDNEGHLERNCTSTRAVCMTAKTSTAANTRWAQHLARLCRPLSNASAAAKAARHTNHFFTIGTKRLATTVSAPTAADKIVVPALRRPIRMFQVVVRRTTWACMPSLTPCVHAAFFFFSVRVAESQLLFLPRIGSFLS